MLSFSQFMTEKDPCWKGYKQLGMKKKNGREVPNCVPVSEGELGKVVGRALFMGAGAEAGPLDLALGEIGAHIGDKVEDHVRGMLNPSTTNEALSASFWKAAAKGAATKVSRNKTLPPKLKFYPAKEEPPKS